MFQFQQDIGTEVELLELSGKLFVQPYAEPIRSSPNQENDFETSSGCRFSGGSYHSQTEVEADDSEEHDGDSDEDGSFPIARTVEAISECF